MAIGSVSALDQDTWQLIQTNTTTSGATSTFSGLSGYKKYIIAWQGVTQDTDGSAYLQFNSDTGNNYFGGMYMVNGNLLFKNKRDRVKLTWTDLRTELNGYISIENVNNGAPKLIDGVLMSSNEDIYPQKVIGGWVTTSAITSIVITAGGSGTFTAGSMKLYGVAG
jgi:hypothetical protein